MKKINTAMVMPFILTTATDGRKKAYMMQKKHHTYR